MHLVYRDREHTYTVADENSPVPPEVEETLLLLQQKSQQPEKPCCQAQQPVGRYAMHGDPGVGMSQTIFECPTCGRVTLEIALVY